MKPWRITKEDYEERRKAFLKELHTVNEWAEFSMSPQTPENIIFRTLLTLDDRAKDSYICFAYSSQFHDYTPELLDDSLFLQSGFFDYKDWNWTDEAVNGVIELMQADDPLTEIIEIARGDKEFPEIRKRCKQVAEWYRNLLSIKIVKIQKELSRLSDMSQEVDWITKRSDWILFYEKSDRIIEEMLDTSKKQRQAAKVIKSYHDNYIITNRMDWNYLKRRMPRDYIKNRSVLISRSNVIYERKENDKGL